MPLTDHIAHVAMSSLEDLDVEAVFACRHEDTSTERLAQPAGAPTVERSASES
jgi:hypothetical protein